MARFTFLLVLSLFFTQLFSQPSFDKDKMDELLKLLENNKMGMGSVAVMHKGKEVYTQSYGYRQLKKKKKKANSKTQYRIGSISKTFTAAIILKLVEEDKLNLESFLDEYFKEIPNANSITINQMLRHRSGIANFTDSPDYLSWHTQEQTQAMMVNRIKSLELAFNPGDQFGYSNSNYYLLALIAEKISGKTYSELLREYITAPFKLKNTRVGDQIQVKKNQALSYNRLKNWELSEETHMSIPLGGGNIISTPSDLNTFFKALFQGKIISMQSLENMMLIEEGVGLGIFEFPFIDQMAYGHTGGIDGFRSIALYQPNEDFGLAITANAAIYPIEQVALGVASIYFGLDFDFPDFSPGKKMDAVKIKVYLGVYSNPSFPLKITITQKGGQLLAQATGQPQFELENYADHQFKFDPAGLKITFNPDEGTLLLFQGGQVIEFQREEEEK